MFTEQEVIGLQAEHHPLVPTEVFADLEEYCLHLLHQKAYEEAAQLAQQKVVLDMGCNNGYGTYVISTKASRVVGVDVSHRAIEAARRAYGRPGVEFLAIDGMGLPFADHSFELIVSFQVIEHIAEVQPYLQEIARVLTPDGIVLFTTPNARIRLDPGMKPWNEFHVREFTVAELSATLRPVFAEVKIRGLFASHSLHSVEFNRIQKAREQARKQAQAILPPWWKVRSRMIDGVKAVLPHTVVANLRRAMHKTAQNQEAPVQLPQTRDISRSTAAWAQQYSTADLCYREEDMDSALDLMAVCRVR